MSNKQPVLSLASFAGESKLSGSDNINFRTCPVCHSDKWKVYVNTQLGVWVCFDGLHSAGGKLLGPGSTAEEDLYAMLNALKASAPEEADMPVRQVEGPPPSHTRPLSDFAKSQILHYWRLSQPNLFGLRCWDSEEKGKIVPRILVPFYDDTARLVGFTGRTYYERLHPDDPKYYNGGGQARVLYNPRNTPAFRSESTIGTTAYEDTLFLVEGPGDAMRMVEAGYNAVALCGKTLPRSLQEPLLTECAKYDIITVLLDLDAPAEAFDLYLFLRDKLPADTAIIMAELDGKDPCSLTTENLIAALDTIIQEGLAYA